MQTRSRIRVYLRNLSEAVVYPFETWSGTVGTVLVASITYVLLILSTMPTFSLQMLGDGLHWADYVILSLTETVYRSTGPAGLATVVAYAVFTGVAVVNTIGQLRVVGVSSLTGLLGVLPAFLASGCASCGAGLLGVLGFVGGVAVLPYDGALARVAGLALLVVFLGRAGHPERCAVGEVKG